jgi:hypothetical protein
MAILLTLGHNKEKLANRYSVRCIWGYSNGGANEARFVVGYSKAFMRWMNGGDMPDTCIRASLQPTRTTDDADT